MTKYIAIDGRGGSGKTYLSELLAKRLNVPVHHLDDYGDDYQPFVGLPRLREVVAEASDDVVMYEGVGVFDERFDDLRPYRILVKVPDEIRSRRATGRDVPDGDRTAEDWREIWEIWEKAEAGYFTEEIASKKADLIVGEEDGDFDIDYIAAKLAEAGVINT